MKKTYILALAAATMAFSCNKNIVEQAPEQKQEPVLRTFTCTIAEPDTKLAIDDANGKTTWEVGDQIMIHGEYTKDAYCTTVTLGSENISADGKKATFTIGEITTYVRSGYNSNLYAQYPADAVVTNNHCYWNNRFNKSNAPLMVGYNKGDSFVMHNLCGILSFVVSGEDFDSYTITGNNDETVAYSALQSRIRLTDENAENVDGFPIRASGDSFTSDPLKTLSADFVDGENRIFIPGGVNFTGGFTIKFLKGGSIVKTLSTTKSVNVPRNSYRPMGNVTTYLVDYVAPTSHDSSIDMTGATALDAGGNANCYIVDGSVAANAEKVFTFKAYKGNSTTGVGTVASAEILWETWNNAESVTKNSVIAAVDFDKQSANDYYTIVFKMPASLHTGNALIAAKDALGTILWSWHIWVPATYPTSATYGIHDTKEMMDRNLGALDTPSKDAAIPANAGFFYQWGRKDPLRTISAFDTGALATTYPAGVWTTSSTQLTTENMEASPCVFIKDSNDWLSTRENTLWSDSKQIHDPCPYGYKVPKYSFTSFFDYFTIANYAGWSFNEANYNFTIGKTADPVAVFPFGHISRSGSYDLSDSKAWIWTATYKSDTEQENARAVTVASGESRSCTGQRKANGVYVRCVAE